MPRMICSRRADCTNRSRCTHAKPHTSGPACIRSHCAHLVSTNSVCECLPIGEVGYAYHRNRLRRRRTHHASATPVPQDA